MRDPHPDSLASTTATLVSRYRFFTEGSSEHPAKYPRGGVPRWMIIGTVEDERIRVFEYLVRKGVLVKTADDPDAEQARYHLFDDDGLASITRTREEPVPSDAIEHAVRGVLANYSSGIGPYGVAESVLVDGVPHGPIALERLVQAGALDLSPMSDTVDSDEHHYRFTGGVRIAPDAHDRSLQ